MLLARRSFLFAAPAIIATPGLLMRVKPLPPAYAEGIAFEFKPAAQTLLRTEVTFSVNGGPKQVLTRKGAWRLSGTIEIGTVPAGAKIEGIRQIFYSPASPTVDIRGAA